MPNDATIEPVLPPDIHYLNGALGWLELGNTQEAAAELERIPSRSRLLFEVLSVEWRIRASQRDWPAAFGVAQRLVALYPGQSCGWINQSYSLHEMNRTAEARDLLLSRSEPFSDNCIIPYNLACYECQLGNHDQALEWLSQAAALGDREKIIEMALSEHDLRPLRDKVKDWAASRADI